jgi:hypothetical protein
LLTQELLGLKAELETSKCHCKALEEKEAAARDRADRAEERASTLSTELAKCKAEVIFSASQQFLQFLSLVGCGL